MGYLIEGYKIMGREAKNYAIKHRAGIGTVVSVGGTIISNILSTRAGAQSARAIDSKEAELGRPLSTKEKIKLCWKNHIAPTATAGLACAGAGYSHNQHVKDFNKVATAYAGVKKLYDSAQKATREVLGEKKNAELQDKINQKYIDEHPEVKEKIMSTPNPDPSTKRKFWEPKTGEIIVATVDEIKLAFTVMNGEMEAMKPRDGSNSILSEYHGIPILRLFDLVKHELPKPKRMSDNIRYLGFLKGKEKNGSDDDVINAYFTPMLLDDETMETCLAINWETEPSDMRYGDYLKS